MLNILKTKLFRSSGNESKPEDYFVFVGHQNKRDWTNGVRLKISKIFIHPGWWTTTKLEHDISILELTEKLDFKEKHSNVRCACRMKNTKKLIQDDCYIVGWGLTDYYNRSGKPQETDFLMEAKVQLLDDCGKDKNNKEDWTSWICTKRTPNLSASYVSFYLRIFYQNNKSIFLQGDSGGPLFCQVKNGKFVFAGVNSYLSNDQNGFGRISAHLDFLKEHTGC